VVGTGWSLLSATSNTIYTCSALFLLLSFCSLLLLTPGLPACCLHCLLSRGQPALGCCYSAAACTPFCSATLLRKGSPAPFTPPACCMLGRFCLLLFYWTTCLPPLRLLLPHCWMGSACHWEVSGFCLLPACYCLLHLPAAGLCSALRSAVLLGHYWFCCCCTCLLLHCDGAWAAAAAAACAGAEDDTVSPALPAPACTCTCLPAAPHRAPRLPAARRRRLQNAPACLRHRTPALRTHLPHRTCHCRTCGTACAAPAGAVSCRRRGNCCGFYTTPLHLHCLPPGQFCSGLGLPAWDEHLHHCTTCRLWEDTTTCWETSALPGRQGHSG